jgi:general secretion pathway protein G
MPIQRDEPKVFFPWERRPGLGSLLRRGGARRAIAVAVALVAFGLLRGVEVRAAEVRATRTAIDAATRAVAAYRADHDRACPAAIGELVTAGYLRELPRDAWGRPLRLACPSRRDARGFDIASDGPDGQPGGLDRIE